MADSISVYVKRALLPEPAALQAVLEEAGLPIRLDTDWNFLDQCGWVPMTWKGEEAGCEVELETKIRKRDRRKLDRLTDALVDAVVDLSLRGGWRGYQSAVAVALALAKTCGGIISEDDDDFVLPGDAPKWAAEAIDYADLRIMQEDEARAIVREIEATGDVAGILRRQMATWQGRPLRLELGSLPVAGMITLCIDDSISIYGFRWTMIRKDGATLDSSREARLNVQITKLLWQNPGEKPPEVAAELDRLYEAKEEAGDRDELAIAESVKELGGWPDQLTVDEVTWHEPDRVSIKIRELPKARIDFHAGNMWEQTTVMIGAVRYRIAERLEVSPL